MSLPSNITVKIIPEEAESITLAPVLKQELATEELIRMMLGVTGKDPSRVREILLRGSLTVSASQLRWAGVETTDGQMCEFLQRYPDPEPDRLFDASRCSLVIFKGLARPLEIDRAAGLRRRLFRRRSFWEELMSLVFAPEYQTYSYRERADIYKAHLDPVVSQRLRDASKLLAYSSYTAQICGGTAEHLVLHVPR